MTRIRKERSTGNSGDVAVDGIVPSVKTTFDVLFADGLPSTYSTGPWSGNGRIALPATGAGAGVAVAAEGIGDRGRAGVEPHILLVADIVLDVAIADHVDHAAVCGPTHDRLELGRDVGVRAVHLDHRSRRPGEGDGGRDDGLGHERHDLAVEFPFVDGARALLDGHGHGGVGRGVAGAAGLVGPVVADVGGIGGGGAGGEKDNEGEAGHGNS